MSVFDWSVRFTFESQKGSMVVSVVLMDEARYLALILEWQNTGCLAEGIWSVSKDGRLG